MHRVLAEPSDDRDFAPEPAPRAVVLGWADDAIRQVAAAVDALCGEEHSASNATLSALADRLAEPLRRIAESVELPVLTRIHGDLHLGQLLVVNGDVNIIDFEGEPAKPLHLRRARSSPMRDVAGMIRSFDYAAAITREKSLASHGHIPEPRVMAFLDSFAGKAEDSFLDGYAAGGFGSGLNRDLIDLFLIEKAAYEVCYEAANRPSWVSIPLRGLLSIAARLLDGMAET